MPPEQPFHLKLRSSYWTNFIVQILTIYIIVITMVITIIDNIIMCPFRTGTLSWAICLWPHTAVCPDQCGRFDQTFLVACRMPTSPSCTVGTKWGIVGLIGGTPLCEPASPAIRALPINSNDQQLGVPQRSIGGSHTAPKYQTDPDIA